MPHSSGGGSHGGGSHGGGSSGSSGNHISHTYFSGSRRYRRFYHDGSRPDDYVYARTMPEKTGLGPVVTFALFGLVFAVAIAFGVYNAMPRKLTLKYSDRPAIHDDIGVLNNEEELLAQMEQFYEKTHICSVIYTVRHEDWYHEYDSLESYTMYKYTSQFKDEQHFVIVYSVPESQIGNIHIIPDYIWHAVQGDETDPIITKKFFSMIRDDIQKDLEAAKGPGYAFTRAFQAANRNAEGTKPFSGRWFMSLLSVSGPYIFILAFFGLCLFALIRTYKKEKNMDYEEIPLEEGDIGFAAGNIGRSGEALNSVSFDINNPASVAASKTVKIVVTVILGTFVLIGIGLIFSGISLIKKNTMAGVFTIGFGILWVVLTTTKLIQFYKAAQKAENKAKDPLTAEYPKVQIPTVEYPDQVPVKAEPEMSPVSSEFDSTFFNSAKSDYDSDDEDYRRMKRQGFE